MHTIPLPILIAFIVSFVAAASRIFSASKPFWGLFPAWLQVLFPTLPPFLAAVQSGASGAHTWTDMSVVFIGAAALLLPGLPSHRSSAPLPSNPKPPSAPLLSVLMLALLMTLSAAGTACSIFGAHGSFWPVLEHCAPSPVTLVSQVEAVLLAGGDYEASLKQIALQDGAGVVECAVQAAVSALSSKVGASPAEGSAVARGKAFLAAHRSAQ